MDKTEILKFIKNKDTETINDLHTYFQCRGFFIGILDLHCILYNDFLKKVIAVKLRPYNIEYLKKIEIEDWQELLIENKGLVRSHKVSEKTGWNNVYYHVNIEKGFNFYDQ